MFNTKSKDPDPPVVAGQRFEYLGIEMYCTGLTRTMGVPRITADYVDRAGVVREISFPPRSWEALAKECK